MSQQTIIVVVGSLHYDIMLDAPHRPRKGETVVGYAWRPKFGGKGGNQAIAAARAGAHVRMAGAVGDDDFGRFLINRLAVEGIDLSRVAILPNRASGMSVAISDDGGDYGAVIVSGANLVIDKSTISAKEFWSGAKALILQNEIPDEINAAAADAAHDIGAIVCLNAAPYRRLSTRLQSRIDVLVVNAIEAEQLSGQPVGDLAAAGRIAALLTRDFPCVVVTAGGDGVAGCERGKAPVQIPAVPVELVSTHGAGDVFVGTLAVALAEGQSLQAALDTANFAAARQVSARHTG